MIPNSMEKAKLQRNKKISGAKGRRWKKNEIGRTQRIFREVEILCDRICMCRGREYMENLCTFLSILM